jgi:preprotein translocase subunit SecY
MGSYVPIPGINPVGVFNLTNYLGSGLIGLINLISSFTGGTFNRVSIFSLGIMPYISSSILIQLMRFVMPYFQRLKNDGEVGRKKMNYITRWFTVIVCIVQAFSYLIALSNQFIPFNLYPTAYLINLDSTYYTILFWINAIVLLTTGGLCTMWLGEKISEKGIGNGASVIIMTGILSKLPHAMLEELINRLSSHTMYMLFIESIAWVFVLMFSIFVIQSVRRVYIYYVNRTRNLYNVSINSKYKFHFIPFKVVAAGVMPIIFSQAVLLIPLTLANIFKNYKINSLFLIFKNTNGVLYNLFLIGLIISFTFFYSSIVFPINYVVEDFKRNNILIPGVKPGKDTLLYLQNVLIKTTIPGAIILSLLAILPSCFVFTGMTYRLSAFYGSTSMIIIIGVFIELIQHIDSYLLTHYYTNLGNDG